MPMSIDERTKRARQVYEKILNLVYEKNVEKLAYSKAQLANVVSVEVTFESNASLSPRGVERYIEALCTAGALEYTNNKLLVITEKGCKSIGRDGTKIIQAITRKTNNFKRA